MDRLGCLFFWPYQPLAEHLGVGAVYDLPEAMVMLQASHLEEWNVTFYEAFEQGLNNLGEIDATFTTIDDHSYVSSTGDHYDLSRMLLPELIRELEVVGDPVVMLPNRDRLLVTGSEDRHGLEIIALLLEQLLTQPRPITGLAFRLSNDEWTCWLPSLDHPAYALLKTLGMQSQQQDYAEQRPLLQRWLNSTEPHVEAMEYRVHGSADQTTAHKFLRVARRTDTAATAHGSHLPTATRPAARSPPRGRHQRQLATRGASVGRIPTRGRVPLPASFSRRAVSHGNSTFAATGSPG